MIDRLKCLDEARTATRRTQRACALASALALCVYLAVSLAWG
ncbi:hypothetical protein [Massilia sp. TN1-12]